MRLQKQALVIHDPRVPTDHGGRVAKGMALNVDVPATIMSLATGEAPESYQGRNLAPWLASNNVAPWRNDFFCEHLMDHPAIPKWEGVRGQRYVYARYFENLPEGEFLHDLEQDPRQLKNLVSDPEYQDALATMRVRCDELRDQYGGEYTPEKFPTVQRQRDENGQRPKTKS